MFVWCVSLMGFHDWDLCNWDFILCSALVNMCTYYHIYSNAEQINFIWLYIFIAALMGLLCLIDSYFVSHAYFTTLLKGASSQIVFGFEVGWLIDWLIDIELQYAILMTIVFHVAIKYIIHSADLRNASPWEQKTGLLIVYRVGYLVSWVSCFIKMRHSIVVSEEILTQFLILILHVDMWNPRAFSKIIYELS